MSIIFVAVLFLLVSVASYWIGKHRANIALYEKGFQSGRLAALNEKRHIIRKAYMLGATRGSNEFLPVQAET